MTSPSLWLMNTTALPAAVIARTVTNSASASCGVSTAVGLVEQQDLGAAVERLDDLDPLPFADREIRHPSAWIDR